jgi:thiosulfate/3-mercaptopyruvate sulfurtransferase
VTYTTLISTGDLSNHLDDPQWAIVDCRFSLADVEKGRREYLQSHIPGALYAHLDEDLSGPLITGKTGRHPLPSIPTLVETISRWGIDASVQVVAYDDVGGALAAARLWWLLRWLGHTSVAVLDGGWQHWLKQNQPTRSGFESRPPRDFSPNPRSNRIVQSDEVDKIRKDSRYRLLDSRTADRFRGENETIDPVSGHIPGAISAPYIENLDEDGLFLPVDRRRLRLHSLLAGVDAERAVFYCGSGVTAAQNILAMLHCGLGEARLYAGSWSEWITDRSRPT